MKVYAVNNQPNTERKMYKKALVKGAVASSASLGLCTAYSYIKTPEDMKKVILKNGGKNKYIFKYIQGLALVSALAGMVSLGTTFLANKIAPKKEPKAI